MVRHCVNKKIKVRKPSLILLNPSPVIWEHCFKSLYLWHYEYVPLLGAQFFGCLGLFPCMEWKYHSTSSPSPCWTHCGACLTTASIAGAYYEFLRLSSCKFFISFLPPIHFGALARATWSPRTSRWGSHYFWRFAMWWIVPLVEKERAAVQWSAFVAG